MGQGQFLGRVLVEQMGSWWVVRERFSYITAEGLRITVPLDFVTDFASAPRFLWPFFSPTDPQYSRAAIIHDRLYETHQLARGQADRILRQAACLGGCSPLRRWAIWAAVRVGGRAAYRTGRERQTERRTALFAQVLPLMSLAVPPGMPH